MSDTPTDFSMASLADLADINVSEIEAIRSETLPQGIYEFEVTTAGMIEKDNTDGDPVFQSEVECTVLECISLIDRLPHGVTDKGAYMESLVGKKVMHRNTANKTDSKEDFVKALGRMKSTVVDMGGEWGPSIVDNFANLVGVRFKSKMTHGRSKTDPDARFPRLALEKRS